MTKLGFSFYVEIKNVTKALLPEEKTNVLAMRCYMNGFGLVRIPAVEAPLQLDDGTIIGEYRLVVIKKTMQ